MKTRRQERLNSLLQEVIVEVIQKEVKNPDISPLLTITKIEVDKDLSHAKVFITVIGNEKEKQKTLNALKISAGFIAQRSSKKVRLRYFPSLTFVFDTSLEAHLKIDHILEELKKKDAS